MRSIDLDTSVCYNLKKVIWGDFIPAYKALYFHLFAAVADASEQLEQDNYGLARERLITAQQQAEEQYISADE